MSDSNIDIDATIAAALAKARKGAADAGYGMETRQGSSDRRTAVEAPTYLATGSRGVERLRAIDCPADRIGVSVSLSDTQVCLDYPAEYQKLVAIPMAWIVWRTEPTDRLIARHVDPSWLVAMVNGI